MLLSTTSRCLRRTNLRSKRPLIFTHSSSSKTPFPLRSITTSSGPILHFKNSTDHSKSPFVDVQTGPTRTILPTFLDKYEERKYRKKQLALVFRILHRFKLAEGVAGHCSVRDPVEPDTFWVNPQGRSFALMRQSTLVRCRVEDGATVEGDSEVPAAPVDASASSIHSQIYKALGRGKGKEGGSEHGVEAIVHVHGPYMKAFSALGRELDMINQDSCAYADAQALIKFGGAVFDNQEGKRIASHIANGRGNKVAILQNHGVVSLGRLSIDEAAWWQINMEMCCQAQLLADSAKRPGEDFEIAGPGEIASTMAEIGTPEMGWFCLAAYVEEEEAWSKGDHKL